MKNEEKKLFLKRWVKHPLRLGSIIPSSKSLGKILSKNINLREDSYILETGAGTGSLTRTILESGVPVEKFIAVELDKELCEFLKKTIPNLLIIQGNAAELEKIIPKKCIGKISTIISGLPFTNMKIDVQSTIVSSYFKVMDKNGEILQFCFNPTSPLSAKRLGLEKERLGTTFRNIPPATVWRYKKALDLIA